MFKGYGGDRDEQGIALSGLRAEKRIVLSGLSDEAGSSLREQIQAHEELGWRELEIRTVNGSSIADIEETDFQAIRRDIEAAHMRVTVVSSRIANWERPITAPFEWDAEELKRLAARVPALGTKYIRIMSYPNDGLPESVWRGNVIERIRRLTEIAADAGLILLHENCAGWAGASADHALDLVKSIDLPNLRLLFDTGNGIAYRYDTHEYLKKVLPYVSHVHIKDGIWENEQAVYSLPGEGQSRVRESIRLLFEHHYSGIFAIEPHLHLIPHLKQQSQTDGGSLKQSYIAYGRRLESLLNELQETETQSGGVFV
ncbi:sugar phosphate isomerase/epimerase family protein [Paenibacillus agilis]|uniref:Sugar phosphate isomerase/epimerase n=1 Tax=Paenibacillus agilis TaxID=3020863 RepID=A0A559J3E0_9BACL|nr:sugar phosphate isomerase/epimerase family protein [Paenibacillus agilis]TVX94410.1 sugar phosphate isomerase/epimerase [Paenibacillus agilis]